MGYVLEGGPRNGEFVDEVPEGYEAKGVDAGVVSGPDGSPVTRAVWDRRRSMRPKDLWAEQEAEEDSWSMGEGARREMFRD